MLIRNPSTFFSFCQRKISIPGEIFLTISRGNILQELQVPMNEDLNIYDGRTIEGSSEAKSRSTWLEMFDMIDLAINNLQQQNKDLKRQVTELSSKINKVNM